MLSKRRWKMDFAQELVRLTRADKARCGMLLADKLAERAWSEAVQPVDPVEFARGYYTQLAVDGWPLTRPGWKTPTMTLLDAAIALVCAGGFGIAAALALTIGARPMFVALFVSLTASTTGLALIYALFSFAPDETYDYGRQTQTPAG